MRVLNKIVTGPPGAAIHVPNQSRTQRRLTEVWNKQKDEPMTRPQPEPIRTTPPAAPQGPVPHTPAPAARGPVTPATTATIGPSMNIKGEIRSREELLVDGEVEGLLESQSLLTVGPNGKVRANIK